MYVWKNLWKLLSSYMSQSLFLVKFYAFSIFVSTTVDRHVWGMNIILWEAFYLRHSNNIQESNWNYKSLIAKTWYKKVVFSRKSYFGNKEQKAMLLAVPRLDAHFGFVHLVAHLKNQSWQNQIFRVPYRQNK